MDISRREFLASTGGAVAVLGLRLPSTSSTPPVEKLDKWRVIGSSRQSPLPESLRGYSSALPKQRQRLDPSERTPLARCAVVIVPALVLLDDFFADSLTRCMQRGATVIIESGAGFASHWIFRQHRRRLREGLQIPVAAPVDLWSEGSSPRTPYVEYSWPRRATIRDFSRVVPPGEQPGEVIAWAGNLPVALKRRVGAGTLIYLGSPVGPALWAGDAEARRWLYAVALAA
jgi:hypothetical protein